MDPLEQQLRTQFAVIETRVEIGGQTYSILHPPSADELIDEDEFNADERIPYWAEIWPSAYVLAERMSKCSGQGQSLLELGCGCGLVAVVAGQQGFEVLATDYYAAACEFVTLNATRHGLQNVAARMLDWRELPADLGKFDFVIAGDVLYERQYCQLIAGVLACTLAAHGTGIVTDPGRHRAATFLDECAALGLVGARVAQTPYDDGTNKPVVDIYEVRWQSTAER